MIPVNFDYYRPDTLKEAVMAYRDIKNAGLKPYYYGGGTEIITMSRVGNITPDAVIDIKNIPECYEYGLNNGKMVFGAGVTLTKIVESGLFPLLGKACGRVADHSAQGKITLGGNICGTVIYRESLLPLLLCDAEIIVARADGLHKFPVMEALNSGKRLQEGELLVKVSLDKEWAKEKYWHIKKVKAEKIGYPLVSVSALSHQGIVRMAFSGACGFPLRIAEMESAPSPGQNEKTARGYILHLPSPVREDLEGSAKYREWVFQNTIAEILNS